MTQLSKYIFDMVLPKHFLQNLMYF